MGQLATTHEIVPPFFKHKSHDTEMVRGICPTIVAIVKVTSYQQIKLVGTNV